MKRVLRVYAIADIHSPDVFEMPKLDPEIFDVVLTLGDIDEGTLDYISHMSQNIPAFGIPGGHDDILPLGVNDLHRKVVTVNGIRIGGFGSAPKYKEQSFHYSSKQVAVKMLEMPKVDVFITHTPPLSTSMEEDPLHKGFDAFDRYIKRCRPRYMIHGHLERNYVARVYQTEVHGIAWKRPLMLSFEKERYPSDNHDPKNIGLFSRFLSVRNFFNRGRLGVSRSIHSSSQRRFYE
jgi:hypothetical protein